MVKRMRSSFKKARMSPSKEQTGDAVRNASDSLVSGIATGVEPTHTVDAADLAFWPGLAPIWEKEAVSAGRGAACKRLSELCLTIRAVSDGYPVPRAAVERLVFDVLVQATDPNLKFVERQRAQELLVRMVYLNTQPRKLPEQMRVASPISVREMLKLFEDNDDDLDMRPLKVIPGSEDDYAE